MCVCARLHTHIHMYVIVFSSYILVMKSLAYNLFFSSFTSRQVFLLVEDLSVLRCYTVLTIKFLFL